MCTLLFLTPAATMMSMPGLSVFWTICISSVEFAASLSPFFLMLKLPSGTECNSAIFSRSSRSSFSIGLSLFRREDAAAAVGRSNVREGGEDLLPRAHDGLGSRVEHHDAIRRLQDLVLMADDDDGLVT